MNQDGTISTEIAPDEVPFWRRANITQHKYMRLASIALNLASIVYATYKDTHIRAEIAELREIINGAKGESKSKDQA